MLVFGFFCFTACLYLFLIESKIIILFLNFNMIQKLFRSQSLLKKTINLQHTTVYYIK